MVQATMHTYFFGVAIRYKLQHVLQSCPIDGRVNVPTIFVAWVDGIPKVGVGLGYRKKLFL